MNREIKKIAREFNRVYQGDPWFGGSIKSILNGVTSDMAFKNPLPDNHSIAALVSHMIGWKKLLLMRLRGDTTYSVKQKETFDCTPYGNTEKETWERLLVTLDEMHLEIIALLNEKEDAILKEKVAKRSYNFYYLINGIIQHDIYHTGQIALLKKGLA